MHEQTIWLPLRATAFTEICEACEDEHAERGGLRPTVSGRLPIHDRSGWATCPRGHTMRVLRMGGSMPAGALR
ncbi:MAG: hypothetical protein ICV64_08820 [Thermoleophilia bacterium]|nr:hypothetical protein [Thermoleophilia bacterium]